MGDEAAIHGLPEIQSGVYRHFKGGLYWVSGIVSIDEESGTYRVLYWSLVKRVWWAREYKVFTGYHNKAAIGALYASLPPELREGAYIPVRLEERFVRVGGRFCWWWLRVRYALGLLSVPS